MLKNVCPDHTAGYEEIFGPKWAENLLPSSSSLLLSSLELSDTKVDER